MMLAIFGNVSVRHDDWKIYAQTLEEAIEVNRVSTARAEV